MPAVTSEVLQALDSQGLAGSPVYDWGVDEDGSLFIYIPGCVDPLVFPKSDFSCDDLTLIAGVGDVGAAKLCAAGLDSFEKVRQASFADLVDIVGGNSAGRIVNFDWRKVGL